MIIYLVGGGGYSVDYKISCAILESFAYVNKNTPERIKNIENFILDSGAYTWMAGRD